MRLKLITGVTLTSIGIVAGGAYAYDSSNQNRIADGVRIGDIDVGGLTSDQATERVHQKLLTPLKRSISVKVGSKTYTLSAKQAAVSTDVDGMVQTALAGSREGWFGSRAFRDIRGQQLELKIPVKLSYSKAAVNRFASKIKAKTVREPRDASLSYGRKSFKKIPSSDGLTINQNSIRKAVKTRLLNSSAKPSVRIKTQRVKPKVTTAGLADAYPTLIIVDRAGFKLRFYQHLKLAKVYKIAVGQVGLETPAGLYNIQDKAVNPVWHVPNSKWAGKLAGKVIPGGTKRNPIKARWLGIAAGVGIHGTADEASLGSNASHGCVRMAVRDVKVLYDLVPVGTTIYIA